MPLAYALEAGKLTKPRSVDALARAKTLIDRFVDRLKTVDDRIAWTSPLGRSGIVRDEDDRSLRIDFQEPCADPVDPAVQWANMQLQHGGDSHACILFKMGPAYPAVDIGAAFKASLEETRNARLVWRFLPNKMEYAVLRTLDPQTPRTVAEIDRGLRNREGWGVGNVLGLEFQHEYMMKRIEEALQQLVLARMARRSGPGWVSTPDGVRMAALGAAKAMNDTQTFLT